MSETNSKINDEAIQRVEILMRQNDFLNVNVLQALAKAEFSTKPQVTLENIKEMSKYFHINAGTLFNHYIAIAKQEKQRQQSDPEGGSASPSVDPDQIQNEEQAIKAMIEDLIDRIEHAKVRAEEMHKFFLRAVPYQCNKRESSGCPTKAEFDTMFEVSGEILKILQLEPDRGVEITVPSRAEELLDRKLSQGLTPEEQEELDRLAREDSLTTEGLEGIDNAIESLVSDQAPIEIEREVNEPEEDILTPKQDPNFKDDLGSFLDEF